MSLDKDREFAEQLRAMRPAEPSPALEKRISESISAARRKTAYTRWRMWAAWGSFATAAAALVVFGLTLFQGGAARQTLPPAGETPAEPPLVVGQTPTEDPESFEPVLAENNLKGRVDEGIVFLKNGLTARRYRYEFVDRVVWRNPADGAVVEMEIPRDEVVLIPVQTF